ncbi:FMRFamide-related peptides type HF-4 [Labeo rohita]|uniref:FMRFamide-related peptides type HF-4 n=1 Tax=Labeo rohita TaxID=84645 RepID=A0ABQ8MIM7_LABRO|nr:FMRFamide-related peptides type HF-4 [Labeo rohita]
MIYLPVWNSHPPSLFCLCQRLSGHRCPLTAPLLTLSPPPVQWARRGSASFHQCRGWRILHLRLQPQSPELRLGPLTLRLHHGSQRPRLHRRPSVHQLHRAPSSFRLHLDRSSSLRHLRTLFLWLRLVTPSHRLLRTPPSLRHSLHPLSLRLRRRPPDLRLHLGRQSLGLRLGPSDPRCRPGSSGLRLRLGLLRQRLRLCQSAPWSHQPFLHHGSSLRRLHRGSSSWLRSGSPSASPAPGPSCVLLGSSHLRHPPGLCCISLYCLSGHGLLNSPIRHGLLNCPPTLPFGCYTARDAPVRRGA